MALFDCVGFGNLNEEGQVLDKFTGNLKIKFQNENDKHRFEIINGAYHAFSVFVIKLFKTYHYTIKASIIVSRLNKTFDAKNKIIKKIILILHLFQILKL